MIESLGPARYDQLFPAVGSARTLGALEATIEALSSQGFAPAPDSRLRAIVALLGRVHADPELINSDPAMRRILADAQRSVLEFSAIAITLPKNDDLKLKQRLRQKLQKAYGGSLDPFDETGTNAAGRDIQFELWLASWFAFGEKPVQPGGPDLLVEYGDALFGIAVKRTRSSGGILERVKKAAAQIQVSTVPGFVALGLDDYAFPERLITADPATLGAQYFKTMPEVVEAIAWLRANAKWVHGMICFARISMWRTDQETPGVWLTNLVHQVYLGETDSDRDRFVAWLSEHSLAFRENWGRFVKAA